MGEKPLPDSDSMMDSSAYLYDLNRKRRKPNFTEPELVTLVDLWAQYKTILRGPATDTVMRSTKARVWRKITDEMNRRYPFVLRRVCDIRGKWEKLMCEARACLKVKGLQPCRGQPAPSTQRKRPSRILRRIMVINWPSETDLLSNIEQQPPCEPAASSKCFSTPPTPPPMPQQPKAPPQQQQQTTSAAGGHQYHGPQPQQYTHPPTSVQQHHPLPPAPPLQPPPHHHHNHHVQPPPPHPPTPVSMAAMYAPATVQVKEDPDSIQVIEDESSGIFHCEPAVAASTAYACPDERPETDEEVRRDILELERTKLRREIEKLDLEIDLLRRRQQESQPEGGPGTSQ